MKRGYISSVEIKRGIVIKQFYLNSSIIHVGNKKGTRISDAFNNEIRTIKLLSKIKSNYVQTPILINVDYNNLRFTQKYFDSTEFYAHIIKQCKSVHKKSLIRTFEEFGKFLAEFHNISLEKKGSAILHGDLCSHNLHFINNKIFIYDPSGEKEDVYFDLARFSLNLMLMNPIINRLISQKCKEELKTSFLRGYFNVSKIKYDEKKIMKYLIDAIDTEMIFLKKNNIYLLKKLIMNYFSKHLKHKILRQMKAKEWNYTNAYFKPVNELEKYDRVISNRFEKFIWQIEKKTLKYIYQKEFSHKKRIKYLDFACGSGRIIKFFSTFIADVTGMDSSKGMVEIAKRKVPNAKFVIGNIAERKDLLGKKKYNCITSFRLFLNLEKTNRITLMKEIKKHLTSDGLLIINNHMNRYSFIGFQFYLRKTFLKQKGIINTASEREFKRFITASGFRIIKVYRFILFPGRKNFLCLPEKYLYKIELFLSHVPLINLFAKDQIYVCRKDKNL